MALLACLISAVEAKNAFSELFDLEHVDGIYNFTLSRWLELGNFSTPHENKIKMKGQFLTAKLQN